VLSACGGGGGGGSGVGGPFVTFLLTTVTVGGTVNGLSGTLVLQMNGGGNLAVGANGPFTFSSGLDTGVGYNVTVFANPSSQTCTVSNGSGTTGTVNITNVSVACATGFSIAAVSDPLASQQWHLLNTGQTAFADLPGVPGMDINVDPVYSAFGYSGNGVTAAVVDTGMEIAHEDLAANVVPGGSWNFLNNTTDPSNTVDTDGDHGTSVAGLIAMVRNTLGGIGVAPGARLKGFNFLQFQAPANQLASLGGSATAPNSSDVQVFNQSYGISPTSDVAIDLAVEAQYVSGVTLLRGGKGALYVKAAGNGFSDMGAPNNANCDRAFGPILAGLSCENANFDPENAIPYQIVVGAVNADGIKSSYSTAGSAIWVSAPGGEFGLNATVFGFASPEAFKPAMVTTDQSGCAAGYSQTGGIFSLFDNGGAPNGACNYTNTMNGTSSATPVTVGVIALVLEANPALTWRDVKHILASTARQIDAARLPVTVALSNGQFVAEPAWTTNNAGFKFHNWYGFGMVNASTAVNMARTYTLGQLGAFVDTGVLSSPTLNQPIVDNNTAGAGSSINVPGTTVHFVEEVQITITATHQFTGDLAIELTSPKGTRSVLKTGDDGFVGPDLNGMVLLSNAFYGEDPAGNWILRVVDVAPALTGTLDSWKIRVFGH
jgi:subtilisin family serine protease